MTKKDNNFMMIFRQWLGTFCRDDGAKLQTALLIAAAALFAMPAAAQDTTQQTGQTAQNPAAAQPQWLKICSENPNDKTTICVVTRERRAATGQLVATIILAEVKDKHFLRVAVPPAMLLRPGLQVQIDSSKPIKATYTICLPNLCFAEAEVKADYINALKAGNTVVITTLTQQAKPIKFDISLVGFTKSYDGEAIDPKKLQDDQKKLQDELKRKAEEARKQLIDKQQGTTQ
jgi:invasion protein IalB